MEVSVQPAGDAVEVRVAGRLDNTWANYFAQSMEQIVAGGARDLRVDLSDVNFLSSAGIGILVNCYNQLRSIDGSFVVTRASARVATVLKQVALEGLLCGGSKPEVKISAAVPRRIEDPAADYEIYALEAVGALRCRCYGDPAPVFASAFEAAACRPLASCRFALGLGALGSDFEDCRTRFGEFLAVESAAAYQPTEGTAPPDYLVCKDHELADVQVLYALACEGAFGQLIRFEARRERGPLALSKLLEQCAAAVRGKTVGVVMIAEVAGIVGAALRRSPAQSPAVDRFRCPAVGEWVSFSPERALTRTVALVAGVASSSPSPRLLPFLRPLAPGSEWLGHFHAAVFSYRPMQRGMLQLPEAVRHVFDSQTLLSVVHLLHDARPLTGAGESEFERGACWVAEIAAAKGDTP